MPTNKNVHRLNRYAAVKLRQRLAQTSKKSAKALYNDFLFRGWIPESGNGELLSESGFKRQLTIVRRDMNHSFSSYSISFLYRGITTAYRNLYGRSKAQLILVVSTAHWKYHLGKSEVVHLQFVVVLGTVYISRIHHIFLLGLHTQTPKNQSHSPNSS